MKSTFIAFVREHAIVKLEKGGRVEWLACRDFDDSKPEGSKWSSASYFMSLVEAVKFADNDEPYYAVTLCPDFEGVHFVVVKGRKAAVECVKKRQRTLFHKDVTEKLEELEYENEVELSERGAAVYVKRYELGNYVDE